MFVCLIFSFLHICKWNLRWLKYYSSPTCANFVKYNVRNAGTLCRWYSLDPTYKTILKTMNCCSKSGRQGGFFHHRGTNNLLRFFKKSTTTIKLLPLLVWVSMWWCLVYRVDQKYAEVKSNNGGFQLEFVSISRVINHMTCYNSSALIGWNYSIQTGEQIL